MKSGFKIMIIGLLFTNINVFADGGVTRNFSVTGYYSPLPGQSIYATGSYEGDIILNGEGVRGADGVNVFPGMIAAPADYPFGTKICLPDFGCGEVHDRGGAIVQKGGRSIARHDRLDLWLGYGEEGLLRALNLGLWHTKGKIYFGKNNIPTSVNFKTVKPLSKILSLPDREIFDTNLWLGKKGEKVEILQKALKKLNFYSGDIDGYFSEEVKDAVISFQVKNLVISKEGDRGTGSFGPQTRSALSEALYKKDLRDKMLEKWGKFEFEKSVSKGSRDESVIQLQEILIKQELLDHDPTGYFGNITKEALITFQIQNGIIKNKNSRGAGRVGPKTKKVLNQFLEKTKTAFALDQKDLLAFENSQNQLRFLAGEKFNITSNLIVKK